MFRVLAQGPSLWASKCVTHHILSPVIKTRSFHPTLATFRTINQSIRAKRVPKKQVQSKSPLLETSPQRKGVVTRLIIAKPKKPNSAKRKVDRKSVV